LDTESLVLSPPHNRLVDDSVDGNVQKKTIWHRRIRRNPQFGAFLVLISDRAAYFRILGPRNYAGILQHTFPGMKTPLMFGFCWFHDASRDPPALTPIGCNSLPLKDCRNGDQPPLADAAGARAAAASTAGASIFTLSSLPHRHGYHDTRNKQQYNCCAGLPE
jgi:hypothetical protein